MLTLTNQELSGLTGRTQPAAQIRWLRARGWLFEIGGDCLPKVASAYFERRMVLGEPVGLVAPAPGPSGWQVNAYELRRNPKTN